MNALKVIVAGVCISSGILGLAPTASAQVPGPLPGPAVENAVNRRPFLAPHYQAFRTDFGFGAASVIEQEAFGGNVSVEPKLNILDNLAVGARVEAMIGGGGNIGGPSGEVTVKQNVAVATLLKTDFFLTRGAVRPWVGLGIGRYAIVGQGTSTSSGGATVNQNAGAYFGVAPQLGIEMGGFRISGTYNKILGAQVEVTQNVGGVDQKKKYSHDYATVEIGFRIGGRKFR